MPKSNKKHFLSALFALSDILFAGRFLAECVCILIFCTIFEPKYNLE